MSGRHAICVSRESGVRGVVDRALAGVGIAVVHRDAIPVELDGAALVVVDRATREQAGEALCGLGAPVVVVGDDLDDDRLIAIMLDGPVSHLLGELDDRELGITSRKLVSGDLFGIEKYLAPGTPVRGRAIAGDADKRHAIGEVCAWGEAIGARRPVVHRLASVVDELMMNALYDTPAVRRAELRWAADARVIAVSVTDELGALRQRDVIDNVRRARRDRGRPRPEGTGGAAGAGIGLYLVAANVASLVINVAAGRRTEVVGLFDRPSASRPAATCVRSLHVFQAAG
jgi:hypothetical protein